MCWRDDIVEMRWCMFCGNDYFGDLGHRDCPARIARDEKLLATPKNEVSRDEKAATPDFPF